MIKKLVEIRVAKDGSYKMEAKEGFAGVSCQEQTKDLELVLGGTETGSGKTDDYYKDDSPIGINIFN